MVMVIDFPQVWNFTGGCIYIYTHIHKNPVVINHKHDTFFCDVVIKYRHAAVG